MNHNARAVLAFSATNFLSRSVWCESVLVLFVFLRHGHDALQVGLASCVLGLATVVVSVVTGPITEKTRRDTLLRFAGLAGAGALVFMVLALEDAALSSKAWLLAALALWGVFWGMSTPALETMFYYSISLGARTRSFALKHFVCFLGNLVGLVVSGVAFLAVGDEWTTANCRVVMYVGLACAAVPVALLFCFDDRKSAVEATEPLMESRKQTPLVCGVPLVPIAVVIADLLAAMGAGLSMQFFPIFFAEQLELSPSSVQFVYAFALVATLFGMRLNLAFAHRAGRVVSVAASRLGGCVALFGLCALYSAHDDSPLDFGPKVLVLALFVLRAACSNSTRALARSLLTDHVVHRRRSQWNMLEGLNMAVWSASAVVGGRHASGRAVVDNFFTTATLQALGALVLLVVAFPLVGLERQTTRGEGAGLMEPTPREHTFV